MYKLSLILICFTCFNLWSQTFTYTTVIKRDSNNRIENLTYSIGTNSIPENFTYDNNGNRIKYTSTVAIPLIHATFKLTGINSGSNAQLFWECTDDFDTAILFHSANGANFVAIDTINKIEDSSLFRNKAVFHTDPGYGWHYYYMVANSETGTSIKSNIEKLFFGLPPILISPNPTAGIIHVSLPKKRITYIEFEVFDLSGRKVDFSVLKNSEYEYIINLISSPAGSYMLKIKLNDVTIVEKIIKE